MRHCCSQTGLRGNHSKLEERLLASQEASATAAGQAETLQLDLSARIDAATARVKDLEATLDLKSSQVSTLEENIARSTEHHKVSCIRISILLCILKKVQQLFDCLSVMCKSQAVVMAVQPFPIDTTVVQANLAEKDEALSGMQTAIDEQQGAVQALRTELEAATASATEFAANSQQERDDLTASLATSAFRLVNRLTARLFQFPEACFLHAIDHISSGGCLLHVFIDLHFMPCQISCGL